VLSSHLKQRENPLSQRPLRSISTKFTGGIALIKRASLSRVPPASIEMQVASEPAPAGDIK
jgi:hypothetical protein